MKIPPRSPPPERAPPPRSPPAAHAPAAARPAALAPPVRVHNGPLPGPATEDSLLPVPVVEINQRNSAARVYRS